MIYFSENKHSKLFLIGSYYKVYLAENKAKYFYFIFIFYLIQVVHNYIIELA